MEDDGLGFESMFEIISFMLLEWYPDFIKLALRKKKGGPMERAERRGFAYNGAV